MVVANAGFQHVSPVREFDEDRWETMISLLLTSPFLLAKYAWDALTEHGDGRFIAIASAHGLVASPFKSAYVSAKHGVLGLVKTLALEGADAGLLATAVCPGYVRTPLVESQIAAQATAHGLSEDRVLEEVILAPQRDQAADRAVRGGRRGRVPGRSRRAGVQRRPGLDGPRLDRSLNARRTTSRPIRSSRRSSVPPLGRRSDWHTFAAASNFLLDSMLLGKIGPLPDVFAFGSLYPCLATHAVNFASAAALGLAPAPPRLNRPPPKSAPHALKAARNLDDCAPLAPPGPPAPGPPPPGPPAPTASAGSHAAATAAAACRRSRRRRRPLCRRPVATAA